MKKKAFPFKKLFLAYSFAFVPFGVVLAFLSLLRITPVHFYERHYYGMQGFFMAFLLIPFFGVVMGGVNWVFLNFGDYLYSSVRSIWGRR